MKKISRLVTLIFGLATCGTLMCGSVLAMNIVSDNASKTGIKIDVLNGNYYLNSVSDENKLTNNHDGTWSSAQMDVNYGITYYVVDEEGETVSDSYYAPTAGKFVFHFELSSHLFYVNMITKFVYFDFLPMANGNHNGRVWNEFYCYAWKDSDNSVKNADYPGVEMTKVDDNGLYKAELPSGIDRVLFNNNGDTDDHMIKTDDLIYNHNQPLFACTSHTSLQRRSMDGTPSINEEAPFDYYLHTSHNEWVDKSKAYGFEQTEDSNQYLLRCYFDENDQFVIRDNDSGWWNNTKLGTATNEWLDTTGDNILIKVADFYNIYFKPGDEGGQGRIYITKG